MKGFSVLCLIFFVDGIVGIVQGNNMYTLKPGGGSGLAVNIVTICVCLVLGPVAWETAKRRDFAEAMRRLEEDGQDGSALREWDRTFR